MKNIDQERRSYTWPAAQEKVLQQQGSGQSYVFPVEFGVEDILDYLIHKDQHTSYKRSQTQYAKKERELLDELGCLKVQIAKLETEKTYIKREKSHVLCLNLLSMICIGIGCSVVASDGKNPFGWVFVGVGGLLYLVALTKQ